MLPEIHQDEAQGETARVYARIMQVQGTGVVNLIWRHLATIEGALGWAWPAVEAASPGLQAALGGAVAEADATARAHGLALRLGLPVAAEAVVRTYHRGNGFNLLAMTMLAGLRQGRAPSFGVAPGAGLPRLQNVPPMPHYDALPWASRSAVDALAAAGPARASGVRPSLWVHLALWPGVLQDAARLAAPLLRSEAFAAAHAALRDGVARRLGLPALDGAGPGEAVDEAIGRFRQRIPEMLLMGRMMMGETG